MEQMVRDMVRQASAERAVIELFGAFDQRDWAQVRRALTDSVDLDLSSMGGTVGIVDADSLVAGWEAGLAALDAVHHQVGNLRTTVHEDDARVACHGIAYHFRRHVTGRNTRQFVGTYDIGLRDSPRGWHVHTLRFHMRFMDGNLDLTDLTDLT